MIWHKHTENAFFRSDMAYAGKNHLNKKSVKFIGLSPIGFDQISGFKSIESAQKAVDKKWPLNS